MFGTCFQLLITQKILLFVGPTDWLGAAFTYYYYYYYFSFFNTQYPNSPNSGASYFFSFFLFPSTPNTHNNHSPNQELLISFLFFLQPPIPTTTTSVLSLKHKPRKFISILDRPIFDLKQILFGAHLRQLLFFPIMRRKLCTWEWLKPMTKTNTRNNFGCGDRGLGEFNGRWCFS